MPHDKSESETPLVHSNAHARQIYKAFEYYWIAGKQGRTFCFTDRSKEPYKWTDFVPKDDPNFQGLLKDDKAPFPDISAELPGVPLEEEECDFQVVTDEPKPDFEDLATACPKPSSQPRDAARREECSQLDEKSLTTFLLLSEEGERK